MKIKIVDRSYDEVRRIKPQKHKMPRKQSPLMRSLMCSLSKSALQDVDFSCRKIGMERLKPGTPCLVLMNHSCFLDLKIAAKLIGDYPFGIVCTSDGFVGKEGLMRSLGCIPTRKFQSDITLLRDMIYTLHELKSSVLMFPEASYSFDGTATPLPSSLGKCLKYLNVPVIMIKTYGAFLHDPLYNNLRLRKVKVTADMEYLLTVDEIRERSVDELNAILHDRFTFNAFEWQQKNHIRIDEPFRADHLNRVLYKCPHCKSESKMEGMGDIIICRSCKKTYRLTEYGYIEAVEGETEFTSIPDWYAWQRDEVRRELIDGTYKLEVNVTVGMMVDMKAIYRVGKGTLTHDETGFHLVACDGELDFRQKPRASYSLYSDFYWYETTDIICIGDSKALYYCFLPKGRDIAAKARIAAEELYKLKSKKKEPAQE